MKHTKIKFRVEVNPLEEIGDVMSRFDLGISGIQKSEFYTCEWNTTTKVDKAYLAKMKKKVKETFESNVGKVLSIKKERR